jgi:hypothetical protein
MDLTLREEDRRAVDLLLDGAALVGSGKGGLHAFAATDPAIGERVARAHKLVHLLDAMPQVDPPSDLLARTLKFVESAESLNGETAHIPELLAAQRPVV